MDIINVDVQNNKAELNTGFNLINCGEIVINNTKFDNNFSNENSVLQIIYGQYIDIIDTRFQKNIV